MSAAVDIPRLLGWRRPAPWALAALLAVLAALPLVWRNQYVIELAITTLIWATLNQSWNLQLGVGGVWNFAQLAIFAVGGYAAAILTLRAGLDPWLSLPVGGLAAAGVAVLIGIPTLRLRGIYAALLTFSFGEVIRLLVISDESGLTGGTFGLSGVPGLGFERLDPVAAQRAYYWAALALTVLTAVGVAAFIRSPLGLALTALRDAPGYAAARGVSPLRMQVVTFAWSAFIAGVAGAFYAQYFHVISPSVMGLAPMSLFVAMLVVGGLGTFSGPLVGTVLIMVVGEWLRDTEQLRLVIVGAILLTVVVLAPRGLVPAAAAGWRRASRWLAEEPDASEAPGERAGVGAGSDPEGG
ncbi:MAG TPA: branched-chain amino acid ABC transporter permease [Actinomycetota bacterium]|nr:branched-chain amino acid ABC transporter permease [Actinomycetota bacterium]